MKKEVGYIISVAGLVVMALGFGVFKIENELFSKVGGSTITGVGIGLVVIGVVIALKNKGRRQASEEVPIYEGKGKNRKIVGYQRS